MIQESLIVPSESPTSLIDIKKALLTYDKVTLIDPADRDLMPLSLMNSAIMPGVGGHSGLSGPPVRPMGKRIAYDEKFEKILAELKPAIDQNLVAVKTVFQPQPLADGFTGIYLGTPPRHDYPLEEALVFKLYRSLASDVNLIQNSIEYDKHSLVSELGINDTLALTGVGDLDIKINNVPIYAGETLPQIDDSRFSTAINMRLTLIARARIAMLIKYSGYCHEKNIIPVFDNGSYGAIFSYILNASRKSISEIEDDVHWIRRNRALQLCHEEYIDDAVLDSMSIGQVIKLRSRVWGKSAERKEDLFRSIEKIALDCDSDELFTNKSLQLIKEYRTVSDELVSERESIGFKIKCDLLKMALPSVPAVGGVIGQISTGWSFGLTLLTAAPWAIDYFREHKQQLNDIKRKEIAMRKTSCFGLHDFYSRIK